MSESTIRRPAAKRLLETALSPDSRRPIDDLIDRLSAPDGSAWLASVLAHAPFDVPKWEGEVGWEPTAATLAELKDFKARSKAMLGHATGVDARCRATLGYFLAIAVAIVEHGARLSSEPPEPLAISLADLAAALDDAWSDLFMRGALALVD